MSLGLGNSLIKGGMTGATIVTDSLILKHNYNAGAIVPVSDGACLFRGAGTGDRIGITETVFNVDGAAYTFAFWAKRNVLGVVHTVLGKSTTANESMIRFNTSNELKIETDTNNDIITFTLNTIDTNWHHYAITITGSGATIVTYQDGAICSNSGNVGDDNMTIDLIGAQNPNGADYEMDGYLCTIGIWSGVLTQTQIKSIMWKKYADLTDSDKDAGATGSSNLVSWWNLDSSFSGSVTNDELLVYDNHYNAGTDILGDNVLLDGTFTEDVGESASGTYWTTGAGWTISGGSVTYDGGGDSNTQLDSAVNSNIVDGSVYQIKFDLTDTGSGGVYVKLNNTWWSEGGSDVITGTATHTVYARAGTGTNRIEFETGHDDKAFSLDNITIRKVNGNPGVLL